MAHNYYSSGDEVFEIFEGIVGFWTGFSLVPPFSAGDSARRYSWQKQEVFKGIMQLGLPKGATAWAGWGFRWKVWYVGGWPHSGHAYTPEEANVASDEELRDVSVFKDHPAFMFTPQITQAQQNSLLARGIPALSHVTGREAIGSIPSARNFDMSNFKNGWPRDHAHYDERWLHSDVREMAYLYIYKLFDDIVGRGGVQ